MNTQFDELTKGLAQSVTRRGALRKFSTGLAGMALACFGLANKSGAATLGGYCMTLGNLGGNHVFTGACVDTTTCQYGTSSQCTGKPKRRHIVANPCSRMGSGIDTSKPCSFSTMGVPGGNLGDQS